VKSGRAPRPGFLEKEMEDLRSSGKMNEEKISRFKAANIDQLPGSTAIFQQTVFRLEQDMDNIVTRIRTLQEKIVYLKSQLANIDPMVPILTESGKVASNPNNRLKYLRLQLIQMQSNLSDKHPDIIRLKSEIKELEAQVGEKDTSMEKVNRLKLSKNSLLNYNPNMVINIRMWLS
jgi:succinoglycan biosynthesis transport protein ExoP